MMLTFLTTSFRKQVQFISWIGPIWIFSDCTNCIRCSAIFVTRSKTNTGLRRIYSHRVDKSTGVRCDQTVVLTGYYSKKDYPEKLRRIKYFDAEKGRSFVFLTNQFTLPPLTIAELYRYRWRVEIFFKWIKQHLRIKSFFGTSQNAVKTQIWIAVSTYVLVAIMKKRLKIDLTLYTILQILSITLFEKNAYFTGTHSE